MIEVSPPDDVAARFRDRQAEAIALHAANTREHLRSLITAELVEEHWRDPSSRTKSRDLMHVLDIMRQAPVPGKLAILAVVPGETYQIIRLSGSDTIPNDLSDTVRFSSEDVAMHEVFLRRLEELGLWSREGTAPTCESQGSDEAATSERYLMGYTDRLNPRQGERVSVYLSSSTPVVATADLVTLGYGEVTGEVREDHVASLGEVEVRDQPIAIGSTAVVDGFAGLALPTEVVVGLSIMPTASGRGRQTIATQVSASESRTWWLDLDESGHLEFVATAPGAAELRVRTSHPLSDGIWYSVAIGFGSDTISVIALPCSPRASAWAAPSTRITPSRIELPVAAGTAGGALLAAPLRFAARSVGDSWEQCYDGKIETSFIVSGSDVEAVASARSKLVPVGDLPGLLIAWDISAAIGPAGITEQVIPAVVVGTDRIGHRDRAFDAACVNTPAWAVTSSAWDASEWDYRRAPELWSAIHFHRDDLDDCRWQESMSVEIPEDLPSGAYAIRITAEEFDSERLPVFVEPATRRASIAVIIPTCSYLAYANDHPGTYGQMAQAIASRTPVLLDGDMFMQRHPELGRSCYDSHFDGSGVGYSSLRRPLLNMRPTHRYHMGAWQLPADLHLISWLRDEGVEFDVITDHTLNELGAAALAPYATVMTTTHSEYYSTPMLDGVEQWIEAGGRFMYLGGNGFYWRVAIDPARPWVMEVRRGESASRAWETRPGELHHAFSGERGGVWKSQGRPPQKTFGVGFCSQGFDAAAWYRKLTDADDPRAAFIFAGVESDTFGHSGREGGGAAGQEIDRYDLSLGTPADTLLLATSEGLTEGYLRVVEEIGFLVSGTAPSTDPFIRADMTYFVNANGGAVLSTGSIAWCGSLGIDEGVSTITRNVIRRFDDKTPLTW
jgi:N,N-dimethylformamidase